MVSLGLLTIVHAFNTINGLLIQAISYIKYQFSLIMLMGRSCMFKASPIMGKYARHMRKLQNIIRQN